MCNQKLNANYRRLETKLWNGTLIVKIILNFIGDIYNSPIVSNCAHRVQTSKMPFIWDDNEWMLIDDDDSYDRNRFVVVHKLHVKLANGPWQIFVSKLREHSEIRILPSNFVSS